MQTTSNILEAVIELSPANRTIVGAVAGALLASQRTADSNTQAIQAGQNEKREEK